MKLDLGQTVNVRRDDIWVSLWDSLCGILVGRMWSSLSVSIRFSLRDSLWVSQGDNLWFILWDRR